MLRKARKAFEKKLYKEVKKNPKALYRYINAKKGNRTPITKLRQRNGMNTSNDREAAEEFNEFFQSVFARTKTSLLFMTLQGYALKQRWRNPLTLKVR